MHDHVEAAIARTRSRAMKSDRSKLAVCRSDRSRLVGPFRLLFSLYARRQALAARWSAGRCLTPTTAPSSGRCGCGIGLIGRLSEFSSGAF